MSDETKPETRDAATGRLLPGHTVAETHGAISFQKHGPDVLDPELRAEHFAFRSELIADLGGESELSGLTKSYVERLVELNTIANLVALDLARRGILSPRGRVSSSLELYMKTLDRFDKLAQRIGMERRAKKVGHFEAIDDFMRSPVTESEDDA